MTKVLVVGATGQLGTNIVRQLAAARTPVRAFVRTHSNYEHLKDLPGVELAFGDLLDPPSIEKALDDVDIVIATATALAPRNGDSVRKVDGDGYATLIEACKKAKIQQFIFESIGYVPGTENLELPKAKLSTEQRLIDSGIPYTIFRLPMFMDVWFAFIGSRLPLRGAEARTSDRPFWFLKMFLGMVGEMIDKRSLAIIAGKPDLRNAFISEEDVTNFTVRAICNEAVYNKVINVGGPEVLTWNDVVNLYSEVLGRPVKAMYSPGGAFKFLSTVMKPFAPRAADVLALNYYGTLLETDWDMTETMKLFGVKKMKTAREFMFEKAALPAE